MTYLLRNTVAFLLASYLLVSGRVKKARKMIENERGILSIYFHNPSRTLFASCVKWLLNKGYHFISLRELQNILNGKIPAPVNAVVITVDDGWKENVENVVEFANNHHIPVAIFVSTDPVENGGGFWWSYVKKATQMRAANYSVEKLKRIENRERVKIMNALKSCIYIEREAFTKSDLIHMSVSGYITIGGHTVTHPILPKCSDKEAYAEVYESKQKLERWLNKKVQYFSYPNGDFGEREIKLLSASDYHMGFSTIPGYIIVSSSLNLFALPRYEILEYASFTENICRMTGVWFNRNHE